MTYRELQEKHEALVMVSGLTLPRKVSVAIARNLARFKKELRVYQEQSADIADRYAAKDEDGNFILDGNAYTFGTPEDRKEFIRERKELDDTEVEIEAVKFDASELDRCDEAERYSILTPAQEAAIGWMVSYNDPE